MQSTHCLPGSYSIETDDAGHTRLMYNGRDCGTFHSIAAAINHVVVRLTPREHEQFLIDLVCDARADHLD